MLRIEGLRLEAGVHRLDIEHLDLAPGCVAILLGPSGSGKTLLLKTIGGIGDPGWVKGGQILFRCEDGRELRLPASGQEPSWGNPRRQELYYVFQAPRSHLDPERTLADYQELLVQRLSDLPTEAVRAWFHMALATVFRRVKSCDDIESWMTKRVAELSGGEAQRLLIALMGVLDPRLILADEPLSAQDQVNHGELRGQLKDQVMRNGASLLLVTHEVQDVQTFAGLPGTRLYPLARAEDRYWRVTESLAAEQVREQLDRAREGRFPRQMGTWPDFLRAANQLGYLGSHRSRPAPESDGGVNLVSLEGLDFCWRKDAEPLLEGIRLEQPQGQNLGILGESGVGKSTLAELTLDLLHDPADRIHWDPSFDRDTTEFRRRVQYVFQDCERALEWERGTLRQVLDRVTVRGEGEDKTRMCRIVKLLGLTSLLGTPVEHLSGGQQRLAFLARAWLRLIPGPNLRLLILDEVTVGLDLALKADLLKQLQQACDRTGIHLWVISHDPQVIRYLCDRVYVLCREVQDAPARVVEVLSQIQLMKGDVSNECSRHLLGLDSQ